MSNEPVAQIFQTSNPSRWQRFKWAGRLLLFVLIIAIVVIVIAFRNLYTPDIPRLGQEMKKAIQADKPIYKDNKLSDKYKGFRKLINDKWARGKGVGQKDSLNLSSSALFSDSLGIRAAFYVYWDAQSYFSLRKNINKLNLIIPVWLFIDPVTDTLKLDIDDRSLAIIKKSGVRVMPLLQNFANNKWQSDCVHRILHDKTKSDKLINQIVKTLKAYDFVGLNLDFESLNETTNEPLSNFQKTLYEKMHANNLLVTQNVEPFNEDYDYVTLSKYNDYLFLMAYDEHSDGSKAGPVCSQRWIESAVDDIAKKVSPKKIVLNLAAYGYDWGKDTVQDITYQEALTIARESSATPDFNNDTYNVQYNYYDDDNYLHHVFFTDAATNFNTLRFATEYGLAGTAVWRMGGEDSRIWDFYDKPMSKAALSHFDYAEFNKVESNEDVDYIGEGEVLDVLSTPTEGHITPELDTAEVLISEEHYDSLPSMFVVKKWGKAKGKKLVLTFDDGPDATYTRQILDTLALYHTPAAFFLVGLQAENNIPLVKRIFNEGHEIGNHTFTHPNMAEVSRKRALLEMDATRLLIECIIGRSTVMFRAPFNADSEPELMEEILPVALSRTRNYLTIGESIDPEDWEQGEIPGFNADTIFNRVVRIQAAHAATNDAAAIILLHDAGGNREETVKVVGRIIRYFRAQGYEFTSVADLLGKTKDELMPPVPKGSGYYIVQGNMIIAEAGYWIGQVLYALFLVFLGLGALRLLTVTILASLQRRREKKLMLVEDKTHPLVSIIVPAYNEEVNAVNSLNNLLKCDYPNFEIIFVNDGSKDSTYEKVFAAFEHHPKVKVFDKPNGGKASALNHGIAQSHADFVVCIDADTKLKPDAVSMMMRHFIDEKVGAVAGVVKVGNEVNLLTRWQSIEYITSQNFDRKAFAYINAITVVPGAIGAFRKDALDKAGMFTSDTLAEDCDLTVRILRCGYIVANESNAVAYTEAPETTRQFMKQRFRWSFGVMQTFWKNRDVLFNTKYKALGWFAFPDILLFKYIIPLFAPLADFLMIIGLFAGEETRDKIGKYYLIFLAVDTFIALIAFAFDKVKPWKVVWIIPQRIIYRWIMLLVLFRAMRRALKGELQHWGVLKRTGNVKEVAATN
jgi:cellulose synthase/poly-beta-1,6-N-acetylglucosamine synthase-like glycosyltransferase/spore germination protein YaaH/peptidoglycan/xylan/chitin deacetylase (PgdA/CDA1 family)